MEGIDALRLSEDLATWCCRRGKEQLIHTPRTSSVQGDCDGCIVPTYVDDGTITGTAIVIRPRTALVRIMESVGVFHLDCGCLGDLGLVIPITEIPMCGRPPFQELGGDGMLVTIKITRHKDKPIQG